QNVTKILTLQGASGNLLSLRSNNSGVQARLTLSTSTGLSYLSNLDVMDSNAASGQTLVCYTNIQGGVDSGNNTNWTLARLTDAPNDATYVTNGTVNAVAVSGSITYIGGIFSWVGPATGAGVPFSAATGGAGGTY